MSDRVTEAQIRRELTRMDESASRRRVRIGAVVVLAVALLLGELAARRVFTLVSVRSDGMSGALLSGDVALCVRSNAPVLTEEVRRGSLALVRYSDSGIHRQAVRRVIALAGDEVSVDEEGRVTLNGVELEEPYAAYCSQDDWSDERILPGGALGNPFSDADSPALAQQESAKWADDLDYPITVPEGMAFVLCDNRDNVLDSRSSRFGFVGQADIQGLARAVIWPVYRVGRLDGA